MIVVNDLGIVNTDHNRMKIHYAWAEKVSKWPWACLMLSAVFCFACSTVCHLCYVKSPHICDLVAKVDYWGIAILMLGTAYPQISYKLACGTQMIRARWCFVSIITFFCVIAMILTI